MIGFTLLLPFIYRSGGFKAVATRRLPAPRTQRGPLFRTARLVLCADADRDRAGGGDRIHHADLDCAAGRNVPRERMTVWKIAAVVLGIVGVIMIVRAAPRDQSGPTDRARRRHRLQHLHDPGKIADPDRECLVDPVLDDRVQFVGACCRRSMTGPGRQPRSGAGCSSSGSAAHFRTTASPARFAMPMRPSWCDGLPAGSAHGNRGLAAVFKRLDSWTVFGAALILCGNLLNLKRAPRFPPARREPDAASRDKTRWSSVIWITLEGHSSCTFGREAMGWADCRFASANRRVV